MYHARQRHTTGEWRAYLLHVECVRRNPKYREGYEEWKKLQADEFTGDWYKSLVAGRWGLLHNAPLPDPDNRPLLDTITGAKPPKDCWLPHDERVDPVTSRALDMTGFSKLTEQALPDSIKSGLLFLTLFPEESPDRWIRTVLNIRQSKRTLMQEFEQFIDNALAARKQARLAQHIPNRRVRLQECLDCLKVFDFKQSGKIHAAIGERLWPDSHGDTEKKSRVYYQKAKNLIDSPPLMRGSHCGGIQGRT